MQNITADQFLSPFDKGLKCDQLHNLVSGGPVSTDIAETSLNAIKSGTVALDEFTSRVGENGEKSVSNPITRNNLDQDIF